MSAQNGPGPQDPNQPGPRRPQPPQVQGPGTQGAPPAHGVPQQAPPQQVPPQQNNDRFRPRPQGTQQPQPQGTQQARQPQPAPGQPPFQQPPMQGQPQAYVQQPMPGQPMPTQPPMQMQPPMQPPPAQARVYAQPRFAPTVTQEMRIRAGMQAPQQVVTETPWTGAVRQNQPPTEPDSTGNIVRLVAAILVLFVLVVGLILLAIAGGLSFGVRLFALIGLSAIPLVGIVAYVLWLDRWKPQPKLLLGICLLWGAVAAVILTLVFSFFTDLALYMVGINGVPNVLGAIFQAPPVEESTKTVLLVVIVLAARRYFEGPLDGLVYGSLIGAGFAFTENILYLGQSWNDGELGGLAVTFAMRCLGSPLLHIAFSTCAGVSIGFAARKWPWWATALMWLPGLIVGILLHGFWNGSMTLLGVLGQLTRDVMGGMLPQIIGLILLSIILSGAWVTLGLMLRRSERMHTQNMLGDYANSGWLTHAEVDMLGTWKGRKNGRDWAKSFPGGKEEMRTMIRTSGKLSTTRMRVLAGIGGDQERKIERAELKQFSDARERLLAASRRTAG
ncbi:PrsW family intramembrane metalloprotease [Brevibacterium oceani]|uniref:PrsW family intramembrane metalloprotease n=1 Tax=Brevibacterium oceani TaxID=358099 RepID=UPI001FE2859D|nr:PrsW family intramembrane metalloprotease [Brevibacterium oceani]